MRVLLVEDEALIRERIIRNINWEGIGFQTPLEAGDGYTALDIIRIEKPDIMILDIRLPDLNGIELLNVLKCENIMPSVIILSGHDEFEYAKQAIQLGVENYLLKPLSAQEIEKNLVAVKEKIIEEINKKMAVDSLKEQISSQIPIIKAFYIDNLINGKIESVDEFYQRGKYLGMDLSKEFFTVVLCSIVNDSSDAGELKEEQKSIIQYTLINIIKDIIETADKNRINESDDEAIIHTPCENRVVLIFNCNDINKIKKMRNYVTRNTVDMVNGSSGFSVTIGMGNVYQGLQNIRYSYEEAKNAVKYNFLKGENQILDIKDLEPCKYIYSVLPAELEEKLAVNIRLGKYDDAKDIIHEFFDFMRNNGTGYSIDSIKILCWELVSLIIKIIPGLGGDLTDVFKNKDYIFSSFQNISTIDEFSRFLDDILKKVISYILNKRYLKYRKVIRDIHQYVNDNYYDDELDMEKFSQIVNMNASYLSHLYKTETGENFSNFLKKYRINKAKEILLSDEDIKICDVAFAVGFKDAHYFTICFREITGTTPTGYKESKIR
jgi:two-component system response regulator YesN